MTPAQLDNLSPNERRKSYRCAIHGSRREARLRIGMRETAAEIVDESTEGFSVLASQSLDCSVGQTLLLKISGGWVEVRVMSVFAEGPAANSGEPRTRLGVLRLRDVEEWEVELEAAEPLTWSDMQELLRATFMVLRPMARAGSLFVLAPVVGVLLYFVLERSAPVLEEMRDDSALFVMEGSKGHTRLPKAEVSPVPLELPLTPPFPDGPVEIKPEGTVALARPEMLLDPDLSRKLELDSEQVRQLRELFDEFRATAATSAGDSVESLNELRRRALEILTDAQRAILAKHLESEAQPSTSVTGEETDPPAESN